MESLEAVVRRLSTFDDVEKRLSNMLSQVGRNAALTTEANNLRGLATRVRQSAVDSHDKVIARTLRCARILPLDKATLDRADELRHLLSIKLPDAVMLAGVDADLAASPPAGRALFANRNAKDFDDPETRRRLENQRCQVITNFETALAKVEADLRPPGTPP